MISMNTVDPYEYRGDRADTPPSRPASKHPVRHAVLHALSMLGVGLGGMGAIDDDLIWVG
jgi:hypothetical protein